MTLDELQSCVFNGEKDPLVMAACRARNIRTISNQEFICLYLLIVGPSRVKDVRSALTTWRQAPKTHYTDYFAWSKPSAAKYLRKVDNKNIHLTPKGFQLTNAVLSRV